MENREQRGRRRPPQPQRQRKRRKKAVRRKYFDYTLLIMTMLLVGIGITMIYSTSSYTAYVKYNSAEYYLKKQLLYSILGLGGMYVTYRIDYHKYQKYWKAAGIIAVIMILALIPFGTKVNGAKRWLRFMGLSIQVSDVVKLAVIIVTASMICNMGKRYNKMRYVFFIWMFCGGIFAGLIWVVSNNLSSAIIIFGIVVMIAFVGYPYYLGHLSMLGAGGIAGFFAYQYLQRSTTSAADADNFRHARMLVWLNPEKYADTVGYQTVQALYAIGSGGIFGKGLGNSLQKLGFIPESQNDMIFAIICEEFGLFGAIFLMTVFGILLWRIVHVAQNSPDLFGTLLAVGVFAHIAIQVVLNIAVVTNTIPNTGVSLPFISYGGSSSVILLAEIGILLNISAQITREV